VALGRRNGHFAPRRMRTARTTSARFARTTAWTRRVVASGSRYSRSATRSTRSRRSERGRPRRPVMRPPSVLAVGQGLLVVPDRRVSRTESSPAVHGGLMRTTRRAGRHAGGRRRRTGRGARAASRSRIAARGSPCCAATASWATFREFLPTVPVLHRGQDAVRANRSGEERATRSTRSVASSRGCDDPGVTSSRRGRQPRPPVGASRRRSEPARRGGPTARRTGDRRAALPSRSSGSTRSEPSSEVRYSAAIRDRAALSSSRCRSFTRRIAAWSSSSREFQPGTRLT